MSTGLWGGASSKWEDGGVVGPRRRQALRNGMPTMRGFWRHNVQKSLPMDWRSGYGPDDEVLKLHFLLQGGSPRGQRGCMIASVCYITLT